MEDPYLQLGDSEDESEAEDMTFRDTDLVILGARNEDDVSHLEVRARLALAVAGRSSRSSGSRCVPTYQPSVTPAANRRLNVLRAPVNHLQHFIDANICLLRPHPVCNADLILPRQCDAIPALLERILIS